MAMSMISFPSVYGTGVYPRTMLHSPTALRLVTKSRIHAATEVRPIEEKNTSTQEQVSLEQFRHTLQKLKLPKGFHLMKRALLKLLKFLLSQKILDDMFTIAEYPQAASGNESTLLLDTSNATLAATLELDSNKAKAQMLLDPRLIALLFMLAFYGFNSQSKRSLSRCVKGFFRAIFEFIAVSSGGRGDKNVWVHIADFLKDASDV